MLSIPTEHLRWYGWQPFMVWSTVEWCGHRLEGMPVPDVDGRWRLSAQQHERARQDGIRRQPGPRGGEFLGRPRPVGRDDDALDQGAELERVEPGSAHRND